MEWNLSTQEVMLVYGDRPQFHRPCGPQMPKAGFSAWAAHAQVLQVMVSGGPATEQL